MKNSYRKLNPTFPFCLNKRLLFLLVSSLLFLSSRSQSPTFIVDFEKLFTNEEVMRIDSLLSGFNQRTGKLVAVVTTDTLDIPPRQYIARFITRFGAQFNVRDDQPGICILLSSKQSRIQVEMSDHLKPTTDDLSNVIRAGIPDLTVGRRSDGLIKMCLRAIEYLDNH